MENTLNIFCILLNFILKLLSFLLRFINYIYKKIFVKPELLYESQPLTIMTKINTKQSIIVDNLDFNSLEIILNFAKLKYPVFTGTIFTREEYAIVFRMFDGRVVYMVNGYEESGINTYLAVEYVNYWSYSNIKKIKSIIEYAYSDSL